MDAASMGDEGCPPDDAFARFVAGDLSGDEREVLLEHADNCETCHELLAGVLRGPGPAAEDQTVPNARGAPAPSRPKPGQKIDHYVVSDVVGAGAMGVVMLARDTSLERDVALKLLNRAPGLNWEQRLVREAQALAQLTHPNVVTVYAVGRHEGNVYVAMEFVRGQSLRRWLEAKPRAWPDVMEAFLQAGQGLAAAHAEGFVHRDFKPDNVLVSDDGRVLVTDFGLAAAAPREDTPSSIDWSEPLTKTGTALGTPRFMAPEQIRGAPVDPQADQFSFAVALYQGLYRRFPFRGATLEDLAAHIKEEGATAPPSDSRVPTAVWDVLQRSLQYDASDRYPTIDEVLADLRGLLRRRKQRRRWYVVAAVGLGGIGGGAYLGGKIDDAPCRALDDQLSAVWDASRRGELRDAMEGGEAGEALFERLRSGLDDYAGTWAKTAGEICEATHKQKVQSEALLEVRMHCLDNGVRRLDALLGLLVSRHDDAVLEHAVLAVEQLPPAEECRRVKEAPVLAADTLPEVQESLARLEALTNLGLYDEAEKLADTVAAEAPSPRARARARISLAHVYAGSNRAKDAEAVLREAGMDAAAAEDDTALALAWLGRVSVSIQQHHYAQAEVHVEVASVAVRRVGNPASLLANLGIKRGNVLEARSANREAVAAYDEALAAATETGSILNTATVLSHRSSAQAALGRTDEALADARGALNVRLEMLGESHPYVMVARQRVATVLVAAGRHAEARPELEAYLESTQRRFGDDSAMAAAGLAGIAAVHLELGDLKRAMEASERALEIMATHKQLGTELAVTAGIVLAHAHSLRGDHARALRAIGDALSTQHRLLGTEHPALAMTLLTRGEVLRRKGAFAESLKDFEHVLKIVGTPTMEGAYALSGVGMTKFALGRSGGTKALEDALQMHKDFKTDATDRAETMFYLAKALVEDDSDRALALAREAQTLLQGPGARRVRKEVRAFLDAHPGILEPG